MEYRTTFLNGSKNLKNEGLKALQSVREDLELLLFYQEKPFKEIIQKLKDRFGVEIDSSKPQDIEEEIQQIFDEYPLSFEYIPDWSCYRYQIAWGGPSYEVRFHDNGNIEFVYLDWFVGVGFNVINDPVFQELKELLKNLGHFELAYEEAVSK